MVRSVVRFFLRSQSQGLAKDDQTHQNQEKRRSPRGPPLAGHTVAMVARCDGLRLADVPYSPKRPPAGQHATPRFGVQYGCQFGVCRLAPNNSGGAMDKPAQNIQDSFLNNARKDKIVLTIYLMSGVKLSGRIKSFDKYSLVLETNNQEQLIFKHAISTVVTLKTAHSYAASSQSVGSVPVAAGPSSNPVAQAETSEA